MTRNGVLPPDSGIETPLGGFLRETRLDELPQLLNVIRGDMNLCGPRPVRPEIAGIYRRGIPRYDDRFAVRPGLVGLTQAYFNHGTSKAIRARYNSVLVRTSVSYRGEIGLLVLVGSCVLARSGRQAWQRLRSRLLPGAAPSKAGRATDFALTFIPDDGQPMPALAVDETRLWLRASDIVPEPVHGEAEYAPAIAVETVSGRLTFRLPDGKLRVARVVLDRVEGDEAEGSAVYCYRPLSDFAYHVLSRYLLQNVVVPHKSHLVVVRVLNRLTRSRPHVLSGGVSPAALGADA